MERQLRPHADSASISGLRLDARASRPDRLSLLLVYRLIGDISVVRVPAPADPVPTHGLWRTTCFEAFLGGEGEGYLEINLSPSGAWAAYSFDGYRAGMTDVDVSPPRIGCEVTGSELVLEARIDLPPSVGLSGDWRLGLSAVIETMSGGKAFWALAHPPGQPDFHHPDCFAARLAAPKDA